MKKNIFVREMQFRVSNKLKYSEFFGVKIANPPSNFRHFSRFDDRSKTSRN